MTVSHGEGDVVTWCMSFSRSLAVYSEDGRSDDDNLETPLKPLSKMSVELFR